VLRRLLLLTSVVVFADTALFAAITPILPELVDEFGLSKAAAGLLFGAYTAGVVVFAVPAGLIAARTGVRPVVIAGLLMIGVSSLGVAFAQSIVLLDLARFLQGIGSATSWAGAFGWLASAAPRHRRGELLGAALGAAIVGSLMGPVVGTVAHELGRGLVFTVTAGLAFSLIAVTLRIPSAEPEGGTLRDLRRAARDPRVRAAMWLVMLPGLVFGTMAVLVPLRLDELGAGPFVIGAAWVMAGSLEALVAPVIGRVSDRLGRLLPALFGVVASGVTAALLPWPQTIWLTVLLVVVTAPALGVLWAPANAMMGDAAEDHRVAQALAFGLINLAWALGETIGSAGGARLADTTRDAVPYLLLACVCAITALVLRRLIAREPREAVVETT
jgi:MFS family permease